MASESRGSTAALIDQLFSNPAGFAFVEAVRLLEQERRRERNRNGQPGPSDALDAKSEFAWYRATPALHFPAAEIDALRPAQDGRPIEFNLSFLGLNGPSGVLPRFYSEIVLQQVRYKNPALRDFLDIFNDRAIRHHLAAARKYRLPAAFELAEGRYSDHISASLRALVGLATGGLISDRTNGKPRLSIDDVVLMHYGGLLSCRARSAAGLQQLLRDFLGRPVEVIQMSGRWAPLDVQDQTSLPTRDRPDGNYAQLGVDAVLGTQVFDLQGCFRLRLGPLTYDEFAELLPGMPLLDRVVDLTRFYAGPTLAFELQLALRRDRVPPCPLAGDGRFTPRLGLNTWLHRSGRTNEAEDVRLTFERL
jgi:type VI secretion system protein ImpH